MIVINKTTNDVYSGCLQCLENIWRLACQVNNTIFSKYFYIWIGLYIYLTQAIKLSLHRISKTIYHKIFIRKISGPKRPQYTAAWTTSHRSNFRSKSILWLLWIISKAVQRDKTAHQGLVTRQDFQSHHSATNILCIEAIQRKFTKRMPGMSQLIIHGLKL